jgi:Protein of unknown function (DUF1569)
MNHAHLIPLAVKLPYTLFVAVLVPYYWATYSPWNFLFFCDVALLIGLVALWTESSLLMSMIAVGITLPQLLWVIDFLTGSRITGMTSYMFDSKLPLFVRGLSSFHGWLPFLVVWGVWRLGYDRRAFVAWTVASTVILLASFFLAPAPPAPLTNPDLAVNINYVHGMSYVKPQTIMAPWLWLTIMIVGFPIVFYLPAHLAFHAFFPGPASGLPAQTAPVPAEGWASHTSKGPLDTAKVAGRRKLRFESIDQMMAEVDRLVEAEREGRLERLGNWTLGQTLGHLACWAEYAYSGTPLKTPLLIKWILRLRKHEFLHEPMRAGVKIPSVEGGTLATEPMPLEVALDRLKRVMEKLKSQAPTIFHSIFGQLSHDEWIAMNLRHGELHLGYQIPK